ncbi:UrcA family protein [Novosphingobium sp. KACC 22771]|uniref:UrcA family protein n=1 Tax=Novosphingobium sp. KACC 22771 TaxID=3025670 RepID=UPI00236654DD|nr:UrcA family protein [Novosphingobium sp. KACC 22771]WDF71954.1 UrcA family protein [Novosphingobium sp. KACC 22771]
MSIFQTPALNTAAAFSFFATAALGLATFTFVMPAHAAAPVATSANATQSVPVTFEKLGGELPTIRVSYADLDLNSEQGRHVLNKRLAAAANMVCDEMSDLPDRLKARALYETCREEALDKAATHLAAKLKERKLAQR